MIKCIIVCFDGTWNLPDQMDKGIFTPTNVVKIARAIKPISSDGKEQIVFYDKGVGADQWGLDCIYILKGGINEKVGRYNLIGNISST